MDRALHPSLDCCGIPKTLIKIVQDDFCIMLNVVLSTSYLFSLNFFCFILNRFKMYAC